MKNKLPYLLNKILKLYILILNFIRINTKIYKILTFILTLIFVTLLLLAKSSKLVKKLSLYVKVATKFKLVKK